MSPSASGQIRPDIFDDLCGEWMPQARTWCALKIGHKKKAHRTFASVEYDKSYQRGVNQQKYRARMIDPILRGREKEYSTAKHERRTKMLAMIKLMCGCADCGYAGHPAALEFDHLPGEVKVRAVALMAGGNLRRLFAEVMKCEVVCANCHRIRTIDRGQHRRRGVSFVPAAEAHEAVAELQRCMATRLYHAEIGADPDEPFAFWPDSS